MGHSDDPEVQRRRLRTELKRLRREADLRLQDVAAEMDWSQSKLIRIENGSVRVAPTDVRALLAHYGVTNRSRIEELVGMARMAKLDPWADMRRYYTAEWISYFGLESSSKSIRSYEHFYVPGLLQIEDYARSMFRLMGVAGHIADGRWRGRLRRQDLHRRMNPPEMTFTLDEAVVRRHVGGRRVMRQQWKQLCELAVLPHITIQIVPFDAGEYESMGRSFLILEFADPNDDDVAYLEEEGMARPNNVEITPVLSDAFHDQLSKAISPDATLGLLNQLIGQS